MLSSSTPRAETVDAEREEERKGRDLEEFVNSEIGAISLLVTFTREWAARFNRPVLPLGSLPACVSRACLVPRCCGESGGDRFVFVVFLCCCEYAYFRWRFFGRRLPRICSVSLPALRLPKAEQPGRLF